MTALLDRLRAALAPEYLVERELGQGSMGQVFLALDTGLRRPVAIKLLRPELATAAAAHHFLREARLLARVTHPNVVTVHRVGEADGLFYYVMERVEGPTLAERLAARGPLAPRTLVDLARQLLAGLEAIHAAGIVHRDLKPGNILLRSERALIADFGIALGEATDSATGESSPRAGTPAYMSPEQRRGEPASVRSDLYSLSLVLLEAGTGVLLPGGQPLPPGVARQLPRALAEAVRVNLAHDPADRSPSAAAMAGVVAAGGRRRTLGVAAAGVAAAAIVGGLATVARLVRSSDQPAATEVTVHVERAAGGPLADSLHAFVLGQLAGNPDFRLVSDPATARYRVATTLAARPERLELQASLVEPARARRHAIASASAPPAEWRALADTLVAAVLAGLFLGEIDADPWLPRSALPSNPEARALWLRGERAFGDARWDDALALYREAEALDSTCLLCAYRLYDVDRWLGRGVSLERQRYLLSRLDRFPPHYRAVVRAVAEPWPARYDSLRTAAAEARDFPLAWFGLGDEVFHRGPLYGVPRREAVAPLMRAVTLKPRFGPAWEHLAWLGLAEGDRALAAQALDSLQRIPPGSGFEAALRTLFGIGYAFQFLDPAEAHARADAVVADPGLLSYRDVAAGPRVLLTMSSPDGALYLGSQFAALTARRDVVRSGLLAVLYGATAIGDGVRIAAAIEAIRRDDPSPEAALFLAEWEYETARLVLGSPQPPTARLLALAEEPTNPPLVRQRAAWRLSVADPALADRPTIRAVLPDTGALATALRALAAARRGDTSAALALLDGMPRLDHGPPADPFLPLLTREAMTEWLLGAGRVDAALRTAQSASHQQYVDLPTGDPQAGEVDWVFSTQLSWRWARRIEAMAGSQPCALWLDVARAWRRAAAELRQRAADADARALGCERRE